MPKMSFHAADGSLQEADLDVTIYREAEANRMSVPQYINHRFPAAAETHGTAFEQFLAKAGLFQSRDNTFGIKPPSMKAIFEGQTEMQAGLITREASPASRILFPAVILAAVEDKLKADTAGYVGQFDSMVSRKETITGYKFEQPVLNFSRPEAARMRSTAQGALPPSMLSITSSDVTRKIPTYALGMEITKEAQEATSLDLVTLALTRQAEIERAAIVDTAIAAMVAGDSDAGYGALTAVNHTTLDSASATVGAITHKAWIKWLRRNWRKRQIDWIMCDLNAALAIENRVGKPTVNTDDPRTPRIDALQSISNPMWQPVRIFLLEDGVLPANTILGIDSRYAMWKVESSTADYSAVEEFVLRKTTGLRFDMGYQYFRQFDEAFDVLTLL